MVWQAVLIIIILLVIIALLCLKIFQLKRAAREIASGFEQKLKGDTNTLVTLSSIDKDMMSLCRHINKELISLRAIKHTYEQGDKELKTAITNISHDIRTPLTAIFGYLNILEGCELDDEEKRCAEIIKERCEALKRLSDELFEYSVIMTKEQSGDRQEVHINRLLEESMMSYYGALSDRGIVPEINITETKIIRTLDKGTLTRIISNLISNALKYSDGDLFVMLDEKCVITFSNTAAALSKVEVERLFDRFYTVNDSRISTGLGLSIAKNLAKNIGADLRAELEGNKIKFILTLSDK